jgi:hypothetical protein
MLKRDDNGVIAGLETGIVSGTFITIRRDRAAETGVTQVWFVLPEKSDRPIGVIRWHTSWRKYGFFPENNTIYEEVCLREIADFIEELTKARKAARAEEKNGTAA